MEGNVRMTGRVFSANQDTRDILVDRAKLLRVEAQRMPAGVERDRLMKQARQIEAEAHAEAWAFSPGLQPPT
jgi:hypothetical protein